MTFQNDAYSNLSDNYYYKAIVSIMCHPWADLICFRAKCGERGGKEGKSVGEGEGDPGRSSDPTAPRCLNTTESCGTDDKRCQIRVFLPLGNK